MSMPVSQTPPVLSSFNTDGVIGCLDNMETNIIRGWVISLYGKPVELVLKIDGEEVKATVDWYERADVDERYEKGSGLSGFSISPCLPVVEKESVFYDRESVVEVLANGVKLDWQGIKPLLDDVRVKSKKGTLIGAYVDSVSEFIIKGWVLVDELDNKVDVYVNGKKLDCPCVHVTRVDVAEVYGEQAINSGFELHLPGYMWELADENGVCELLLMVEEIAINTEAIVLDYQAVGKWLESVSKRPVSVETEYLCLLALEHFKYSQAFGQVTEQERRFLDDFSLRMRLEGFLDENLEADVKRQLDNRENVSSVMLREAMLELNFLMKDSGGSVYSLIAEVYNKYSLRGSAKEWYLNLAVQLTCESGEFERLGELTDFRYLENLYASQHPHQLALLLPVLVCNEEIEKATEVMRQIAKYIENSWLPSECIAYASSVVNKLEIEGQIDIQSAERFRFAFISVLDGFKTGWFTRLHDENLVSTMVSLLADVENYTDYHKRDLVSAAIRIYGLSPVFWARVNQLNPRKIGRELARAYAAWKVLCAYLECDGRVGQDKLVLVLESFEYFRTSGNGEIFNFMREVACNYKPEYDGKSLSFYIIQRLITYDRTELLRIAAHPELGEPALGAHDVDYSTDRVNCLRWLGDYHKSAIYDVQIGVSRIHDALRKLLFCDVSEVRRIVEPLLQDIKKESVLLGNWQGMFLGADILISAYQMAATIGCRHTPLLMNAMEMIRTAIQECGKEHSLPAPICAAIGRLSSVDQDSTLLCLKSEIQDLVSEKFQDRYTSLFAAPVSEKGFGYGLGWPQDTLVVIDTTTHVLDKQCVAIRETWLKDLKDRGIPYLFVVGGGQNEVKGDVLELDVPELAEFRIEKSLQLFEWVLKNTSVQYMVKVSDGCFLCVDRYFDSLSYRKYHYYGKIMRSSRSKMDRLWHQKLVASEAAMKTIDKSSGDISFVNGKFACSFSYVAMKAIIDAARSMKGVRYLTRSYCEDKIVGELLWLNNIQPGDEDFDAYINSDKQHELVPEEKHAVGFLPGSHTPGKVARIPLGSSMYEIHEKMLSNAVWPKKIWPTYHKPTIKPNSNQLELLTDTTKVERLLREEIVVVSVVRNEIEILPHFFAHYRAMGVKCFIFVDNCSNDGTREFLLAQDDAFVYSADTEYKHSHYGVSWQQAVLGNHCLGKWVLLADADEFLVYEDCENRVLWDFLMAVERGGGNGLLLYMIDMYPYGDLSEARLDQKPVFEMAPYFDKQALHELHFGGGMYSNSRNFVNGLRHRLAPARINAYVSQKYALFKYYPWIRVCEGAHYATNMNVSSQKAFFAHFKYHSGFKEKVSVEVKRKQHFNGAEEYQKYASMLAEISGGFGVEGVSKRYIDSSSFVQLGSRLEQQRKSQE